MSFYCVSVIETPPPSRVYPTPSPSHWSRHAPTKMPLKASVESIEIRLVYSPDVVLYKFTGLSAFSNPIR